MTGRWRTLTVLLSIAVQGCGLPRDPEGTSDRIASTHEVRVGLTSNSPWVDASRPRPAGIEADLIRQYGAQMGTKVRWFHGSETRLMEALENHQLDLVIGGFEKKTDWAKAVGVTQPFARDAQGKQHVLLTAPGENALILSIDRFLIQWKRSHEVRA